MNSSNGKPKTIKRRDFIYVATGSVAVVGGLAAIWPLIDSMNPSADILALSAVEVDFSSIEVGQRITVVWRSQPVFIARRTPDEIRMAREDDTADLRDPETDSERVQQPEWLIVIGICTHLGCVPLGQNSSRDRGNWFGWFCPCHGSHYDTSGRIRKGPAPRNLDVPIYAFIGNDKIMLGGTQETAP